MKLKKLILSFITFLLVFTMSSPVLAAHDRYYQRTSDGKIYDITSIIDPFDWYTEQINPAITFLMADQKDADGFYSTNAFKKRMKFTSSNKNVAAIHETYIKHDKIYRYFAKLNKVGKTIIKLNNRPVSTISITSYQNPCKSFKIGKTEYVSKFKKHPVACIGLKKGQERKGKIHVQATKDWKLKYIRMAITKNSIGKIKNGQAIKLKGFNKFEQTNYMDNWIVYATFQNNKTKQYSCVVLYSGKEAYIG